jgi:hypothetical protein
VPYNTDKITAIINRKQYTYILQSIQGVSRLVDVTPGGDFRGLCDQKVHTNMCPILDGYGVTTT